MKDILSAKVTMVDDGSYQITVVDYLNDTTEIKALPDHMVSMLPMVMQQLQRQIGK